MSPGASLLHAFNHISYYPSEFCVYCDSCDCEISFGAFTVQEFQNYEPQLWSEIELHIKVTARGAQSLIITGVFWVCSEWLLPFPLKPGELVPWQIDFYWKISR